jgi:hypothetical protein
VNQSIMSTAPSNKNKKLPPLKGKSIEITINDSPEHIRFSPYRLTSTRAPFDITQDYGLDKQGNISKDFIPFTKGSREQILLDTIITGDIKLLTKNGFILNERPSKGDISRNLAIYDPTTEYSYTIGGIGLIKSDAEDHTHFELCDPDLTQTFTTYQRKQGMHEGGSRLLTEEGFIELTNVSNLGTIEYNAGPYHVVRKVLENEKLKKQGINAPTFIAAGPINNLTNGKYGFSIYRSALAPEYLLNLSMYLDKNANLKNNFSLFLKSKYQQLAHFHREIGESHGQPSNTNTLAELIKGDNGDYQIKCQIKDFETNHPIPKNTKKVVEDGICSEKIGVDVKKSPHIAAMIYDLQLALRQELNVLFIPLKMIKHNDTKLQYICAQTPFIVQNIIEAYGINAGQDQNIINFTLHHFISAIKKGIPISSYNDIIGGVLAHALFGFSEMYKNQIEIL